MSGKKQAPAWWYNPDVSVPFWAHAGEAVFRLASRTRAKLYEKQWKRAFHPGVPVIVVGNISVGGTGKTPLVMALIAHLQAAGYTPGLATRGYGRSNPKQALWVDADTPAAIGGDEPVMIAKATGVRVRADAKRARAARALVESGCDVIVCDDGLQHYGLARDIEIEVIDALRGYGNGRLLPGGPLRESPAGASRFDFRVVNLGALPDEAATRIDPAFQAMFVRPTRVKALNSARTATLAAFKGQRVHAVAGIGHPQRFFDMLKQHEIAVVPHPFPDHHAFSEADFAFSSDLPVLMTSKDAAKCTAFAHDHWYEISVDAVMPAGFWSALDVKLKALKGHSNE